MLQNGEKQEVKYSFPDPPGEVRSHINYIHICSCICVQFSPTVTLPASDINAPHPRRRIAPGLWEGEWGGELVDPPSPTLPVPPRGRRTGPRPDPRPPEGGVTGAAEGPCWPPSLVSDGSARDRVSGLWGSRAAKAGLCPPPLRVAFPRRG